MKPPKSWMRLAAAAGLLTAAVLLGGCVYLRLLELKNQLADFDRNFVLSTDDGVRLTCKNPVLQDDDLRWLGIEPQIITGDKKAELWHVRWVKDPPEGAEESSVYDVVLDARLNSRRLRTLHIPERYFEFVSKDLFVAMIRSTGNAQIDKNSRRAEVKTEPGSVKQRAAPPKLKSIQEMLGVPTELTTDDSGLARYKYRYRPQTPSGRGKPIEVTFLFDTETGVLHRVIGKLPKGSVNFNLVAKADSPRTAK